MNLIAALLLTLFTASPEAIIDTWYNTDKTGKIKIDKRGDEYYGVIAWLEDPLDDNGLPMKDTNNPDKSVRDSELVGLEVMNGFAFDGDDEFTGGKIYDPENGKTYKCKMTLEGDVLKVRGYVGIPALGRTETWSRVK